MSIADELLRLEQMRERGSLTDEEFQRAKARVLGNGAAAASANAGADAGPNFTMPGAATAAAGGGSPPVFEAVNGFRRSSSDRWIAGLCGGLGRSTGIASWVWRLLFVLLLFAGCAGVVAYLLLWLVVPLQLQPPPLARSV